MLKPEGQTKWEEQRDKSKIPKSKRSSRMLFSGGSGRVFPWSRLNHGAVVLMAGTAITTGFSFLISFPGDMLAG